MEEQRIAKNFSEGRNINLSVIISLVKYEQRSIQSRLFISVKNCIRRSLVGRVGWIETIVCNSASKYLTAKTTVPFIIRSHAIRYNVISNVNSPLEKKGRFQQLEQSVAVRFENKYFPKAVVVYTYVHVEKKFKDFIFYRKFMIHDRDYSVLGFFSDKN